MKQFNIPETFEVPITRVDGEWPSDIDQMVLVSTKIWTDEFLHFVIAHGLKQVTNDSVADSKKYSTPEDIFDRCAKKADELTAMEHGFGSSIGKARLSIEAEELRKAIDTDARKRFGMKAVDAKKASMTPDDYFRRVATKKGGDTTPEAVRSAFEAAIAPTVAARKAAADTTIAI
jgi:hypothetical protein